MFTVRRVRMAALAAACSSLLMLAACSSTAPRFRAHPAETESAEAAEDDAMASATVNAEAEAEDDRRVDVGRIADSLARARTGEIPDDTPAGLSRDRVLLDIVSFLGVPYRYGGISKQGIDCSGFTALIFSTAASCTLPRSTREQFRKGTTVHGRLQFGDLVFFNTTGRRPSHVGIYLENGLFAHASIRDGVTLSSLESTYFRKRYIGARRIVD